MSPVEIPFKYSHGKAADMRGERRTNGGTRTELNFTPAPERSRTFGTLTSTLPTDVGRAVPAPQPRSLSGSTPLRRAGSSPPASAPFPIARRFPFSYSSSWRVLVACWNSFSQTILSLRHAASSLPCRPTRVIHHFRLQPFFRPTWVLKRVTRKRTAITVSRASA